MVAHKVFASAEAFDEWFQVGSGDKEKEAEVVEQLHKVITCASAPASTPILSPRSNWTCSRYVLKKLDDIDLVFDVLFCHPHHEDFWDRHPVLRRV